MKLVTLGTSCMFPTKDRAQPAMLFSHEGINLLFDAGEGVQRQFRIAGLSPMDVDAIFISHWHGDHSLGVAGMIQCMSGSRRTKPFVIYGPKGTRERLAHLVQVFDFVMSFPIEVHEVVLPRSVEKDVCVINDLTVSVFRLKHGSNCLGFSVRESDKRKINLDYVKQYGLTQHPLLGRLQKGEDIVYEGHRITVEEGTFLKQGRKFVYVSDTAYFPELVDFVEGADLLLCESTYTSECEEKAGDRNHLTSEEAGMLARDAKVKKLVLTHFSQRYISDKPFTDEARKFFPNVEAARDFKVFEF